MMPNLSLRGASLSSTVGVSLLPLEEVKTIGLSLEDMGVNLLVAKS